MHRLICAEEELQKYKTEHAQVSCILYATFSVQHYDLVTTKVHNTSLFKFLTGLIPKKPEKDVWLSLKFVSSSAISISIRYIIHQMKARFAFSCFVI